MRRPTLTCFLVKTGLVDADLTPALAAGLRADAVAAR
jgi:hypothetical protein